MNYRDAVNREAEARLLNRAKAREANLKNVSAVRGGRSIKWQEVEAAERLAMRARRLGMAEEAADLLRDPSPAAGSKVLERIIGANNLLDVSFLMEGARLARAVGRVTLPVSGGTRLGTGFMVSSRVAMTNNHVLEDELQAGAATLEFDFFRREDGTTGPVSRFRFVPEDFFLTDSRLDYTVVAVEAVNADGDAVASRGWFPLIGPSGKAVVGERVSIIQHPNGDPQKVTVHDNQVADVPADDDFLHYVTDTDGGSSGSPVLNINWDLAALHHAAVGNVNEGIRISSIVTRIREQLGFESGLRSGLSSALGEELLSGARPIDPPIGDPARGLPRPQSGGAPLVNADGSVSWVLPVHFTVGVGGAAAGQAPAAAGAVAPPPKIAPPSVVASEDPDLAEALKALEDARGRVYYSASQDRKAKQAYYPSLKGLSGSELYETLSQLIGETHTTTLSYKKARLTHLYPWIDRREDPSRQLRGIYSNKVFDALEVIRQEVQMERRRERAIQERLSLLSLEAVDDTFIADLEAAHPFNCEHVVPQSWFNKRKQPKTDLHHLFTCEWGCNSFRGNHAYFDFDKEAFRDNCGERENSKFEPKAGKGAVARATLYFLLRYPGDISDSNKEMPRSRLATLIDWAKNDKVDRWELHRNAEIQKVQGNRNPLIDFPNLVEKIDFAHGWA